MAILMAVRPRTCASERGHGRHWRARETTSSAALWACASDARAAGHSIWALLGADPERVLSAGPHMDYWLYSFYLSK